MPIDTANTIGEVRTALRHRLKSNSEADCLLCCVLDCERAYLHAHPETTITPARRRQLETLMQKRLGGVPLAYLTGTREFFSLTFEVTPNVLIPRQETETLVEVALALAPEDTHVLELGAGCGAVAIALADKRTDLRITACDNSHDALVLASRNAKRHSAPGITFVESDWYEQLPDVLFDLIISNPPYVGTDDPDLDPAVAASEPAAALFAQNGGLACLQRIIDGAPARLRDGGALAVEHGHRQAGSVSRMMKDAGFDKVHCSRDLAGHPRVTSGVRRWLPGFSQQQILSDAQN